MVKFRKQKVKLKKKKPDAPQKKSLPFKAKGILKFLIALIVVAALGIFLVKLKYMFVDSEHFLIKTMDVELYDESGNMKNSSISEIGNENIEGINIFFIDLKDVKEEIENDHPEFKDVFVRRLLPNKIIVRAKLRKTVAQIRSDRYYLVDIEGVLLPDVKNFPETNLPIITGIGTNLAKVSSSKFSRFEKEKLDKALSIIKYLEAIEELAQYKLKVVDITDPGNVSFYLDGINVEIKIGNSDFNNRLKVLTTLLEQLGGDIDNFKYIDLRFEDPIVGPR